MDKAKWKLGPTDTGRTDGQTDNAKTISSMLIGRDDQ